MSEIYKARARKEAVLFVCLFLPGVLVLPILVYMVGSALFGEYGGTGFTAFYGSLYSGLLSGEFAGWFLVLSPYLVWQLVRLTVRLQSSLKTAS